MESKQAAFGKWVRYSGFVFAISVILLVPFTRTAQGVTETAKRSDDFVNSIGVNTHFDHQRTVYNNNYLLVKNRLSALGVRHIRDHAFLGNDAPFDEKIYSRYRDLATLDIRSTLLIDPRLTNMDKIDSTKIAAIAQKAGPSLEAFEGPNEYDYSGNSNWALALRSYQQDVYRSVKNNRTTSNVPVLGPSLGNATNSDKLGDLAANLDYGNMHSYSAGENPTSTRHFNIDSYHVPNARKVSKAKPLIATETGYHNALRQPSGHPGVSERAEGKYIPRQYLEYFNRGFKRTYGYEFINQYPDPDNNEQEKNFGLLRNDGTAKPAYTALKNMIDLLEDPGANFRTKSLNYSLSGNTGGVHRTLLQKRDGRFYLILWLEKSSFNTDTKKDISVPSQRVKLTLNTQISKAKAYLPNRSTSLIKQYASPSQVTLDVPDHPLVVELTPSNNTTPKINNTVPKIIKLRPGPNKRVKDRTPTIAATVKDAETNLRKRHIVLFVDGKKKSRFSYNRSTDRLKFTPRKKLKAGKYHRVKIIARDPQGPNKARTWRFKVKR
jgi:hypothetical protein